MPYYRDLREYLMALESRGKLTRIKREINKDTQLHPLVKLQFRGLPEEERTAFLFENVIGSDGRRYDIPVATGAYAGSGEIYAIGMMCEPEEISETLTRAELHPINPELVETGPVHEEVYVGEDLLAQGGLGKFPIAVTTPGFDAAPYITASMWVTKDPETGVPNLGMYRAMLKSPTRTGITFMSGYQGSAIHHRKSKDKGVPLEAAIIIGGPPSLGYVAVSKFPVGVSEFSVAGGIAGEPMELVKCKTVDLEVPAHAEIVIEGEISTDYREPEAPFGEAFGFVGPSEMTPCFNVRCITHRHKPIWLATVSQYPPSESSKMRQYANEGSLYKYLKYDIKMDHVMQVAFYDTLGASRHTVIKVKRIETEVVWRTLEAAARQFPWSKLIVAVDEDINLRDMDSVNLAICMRTQPHRDYRIVKVPAPSVMDYSLSPPSMAPITPAQKQTAKAHETMEASKVLIDATMKWPLPPLSLPKKEFMDQALRIWEEEGLPRLKLKEPWWGIDLGLWSDENERHALSAVRGDYYRAGDDYSKRREIDQQ